MSAVNKISHVAAVVSQFDSSFARRGRGAQVGLERTTGVSTRTVLIWPSDHLLSQSCEQVKENKIKPNFNIYLPGQADENLVRGSRQGEGRKESKICASTA